MTTKLTKRDISRIEECHPELQRLWYAAAKDKNCPPFVVVDGARTVAEQRRNIAKGASKTMRSRHLPAKNGWSHATDVAPLVNGKMSWNWKYYHPLAKHIKRIARELKINVEWGGDWKSFKDGPHWQLPWKEFSGNTNAADNIEPDDEIKRIEIELNNRPPITKNKRNFRIAIPKTLKHEGGFVNHKDDKGGPTNKGITLTTMRRHLKPNATIEDLKKLTIAQATDIYKRKYWDAVRADMLPSGVDYAVYDFGVHSGPKKAIKYLQSVVDANADGVIGPATFAAVKAMPPAKIIEMLTQERLKYVAGLPSAPTFLKGWKRRINRVRREALSMVSTGAIDETGHNVPVPEPTPEPAPPGKSIVSIIFNLIGKILGKK